MLSLGTPRTETGQLYSGSWQRGVASTFSYNTPGTNETVYLSGSEVLHAIPLTEFMQEVCMTSKRKAVMMKGIWPGLSKMHYACAALACALLGLPVWAGESASGIPAPDPQNLLTRGNLIAWEVERGGRIGGPEERARMLKTLGLRRYAHKQESDDASDSYVNREIEALQRNGIELFAWMFFIDEPAKNPQVRMTLESFKRHGVHPQIWVTQSFARTPQTAEEWQKAGVISLEHHEDIAKLSEAGQEHFFEGLHRGWADMEHLPKTAWEQEERLKSEAARIYSYAKLVEPYGLKVEIYNHDGWFAVMENELAIIAYLKNKHVENVGLVYNFFHARDLVHDDTKEFRQLWQRIQSYVAVVNISGVRGELENLYPSQGDREVEMMRTIERSGWRGPVGILAAYVDEDPESGLRNILLGTEWLAAELIRGGSGGPRPFPTSAVEAPH